MRHPGYFSSLSLPGWRRQVQTPGIPRMLWYKRLIPLTQRKTAPLLPCFLPSVGGNWRGTKGGVGGCEIIGTSLGVRILLVKHGCLVVWADPTTTDGPPQDHFILHWPGERRGPFLPSEGPVKLSLKGLGLTWFPEGRQVMVGGRGVMEEESVSVNDFSFLSVSSASTLKQELNH